MAEVDGLAVGQGLGANAHQFAQFAVILQHIGFEIGVFGAGGHLPQRVVVDAGAGIGQHQHDGVGIAALFLGVVFCQSLQFVKLVQGIFKRIRRMGLHRNPKGQQAGRRAARQGAGQTFG